MFANIPLSFACMLFLGAVVDRLGVLPCLHRVLKSMRSTMEQNVFRPHNVCVVDSC